MTEKPVNLYAKAVALLARREYARAELKQRLAQYGAAESEIDDLLQRLADAHLQSDRRYSESFVRSKKTRYGRGRLVQELRQKGVDEEIFSDLLPAADEELQRAAQILRKKFRQPENTAAMKQKYLQFLCYRGFSYDAACRALKIWQEDPAGDGTEDFF